MKKRVLLLLVVALASLFVFPTYWMIMGSFTDIAYSTRMPPEFWPTRANLANYRTLFTRFPTVKWAINSLTVAGFATLISVGISCLAGYAFAKKQFFGKTIIFWMLMSTLMIPFYAVMIPLFLTIKGLGLLNTYPAMFLPLSCNATYIFLARQYISTLPTELLDAARMDGASELGMFTKIVLPLSKPLIATLIIFTFVVVWKAYIWPMIVTSKSSMTVLPVAIVTAVSHPAGSMEFGLAMAGAAIIAIPVYVIFILCQKHFVSGITMGGVKG